MKYKFNSEKWTAERRYPNSGSYIVDAEVRHERLVGTILSSQNENWQVGERLDLPASEIRFFDKYVAPKEVKPPFRDRRGRFAKPLEITLYLREIRVVPVKVIAASVEEAKAAIIEGDGEHDNAAAYPSALAVSDILDNLFEGDAKVEGAK